MKLVRDSIPEIIEESGSWCLTRTVHGPDEHMVMLKSKMEEEAQEFSQVVYKLTGKVANYLKENPSKADQTLELIQQVYQLDAE